MIAAEFSVMPHSVPVTALHEVVSFVLKVQFNCSLSIDC